MISCNRCCASRLAFRVENESHAAAGHAAEHPEAPEIRAEFRRARDAMSVSVKALLAQGMMVWIGSLKLRVVSAPIARTSPARSAPTISSSNADGLLARRPIRRRERSRYFSVTISRIGPTFCAMPPWTSTRLCCKRSARFRRSVVLIQNLVRRHEAAAADAEFRIAFAGEHAANEFHARPHAAGILPAAAGAAEPFAEQRARQHQPAFVLLQRHRSATGPGRSRACKRKSARPAGSWKRPAASLWGCC